MLCSEEEARNSGKKFIEKLKQAYSENPKIKVIDVSCFSMTGDYVCPYYGRFDEEAKDHCCKCWNP